MFPDVPDYRPDPDVPIFPSGSRARRHPLVRLTVNMSPNERLLRGIIPTQNSTEALFLSFSFFFSFFPVL